jgi:hypothetical protein
MKLLRSFVIAAAAGLALAGTAETARAGGIGCTGPGCGANGPRTLFGGFNGFGLQKQKLPVFQAAPWYQYWPYDGHFLMPAPVTGPFYGPPLTGNFPVNPYFPGPAIPVGSAYGFGQGIPGGPYPAVPSPPMPPLPPNR